MEELGNRLREIKGWSFPGYIWHEAVVVLRQKEGAGVEASPTLSPSPSTSLPSSGYTSGT